MKIEIIDLGINNVRSLSRVLQGMSENFECKVINSPLGKLDLPDVLILPGVGNFGAAARVLNATRFDRYVLDVAQHNRKVIGICLGMQLLLNESEENPSQSGIGLIPGVVRKLRAFDERVPNVGWGEIAFINKNRFAAKLSNEPLVYFTHSYFADVNHEFVLATSKHGNQNFPAMISNGAILGMQFHPEKSGLEGHQILYQAILESV